MKNEGGIGTDSTVSATAVKELFFVYISESSYFEFSQITFYFYFHLFCVIWVKFSG